MSDYGWIITSDVLGGGDGPSDQAEGYGAYAPTNLKAVGMMGPSDIDGTLEIRLRNGEGQPFQMLDDDGLLYYEGRAIGGDGLEPLDDFGTPNAGATEIRWYSFSGDDGSGWHTA